MTPWGHRIVPVLAARATGLFTSVKPGGSGRRFRSAARFLDDAPKLQARKPRLEWAYPLPLRHPVRRAQYLGRHRVYTSEPVRTGISVMTERRPETQLSASGTWQASISRRVMSAFGDKADIPNSLHYVC